MLTGTNPGRHGVFDFVTARAGSYGRRFTSAADRRTRPVWLLANDSGMSAGVVNVPCTYPPDDVNGYMISGMMGAPGYEPEVVRPATLFQELKRTIGGFSMNPVSMTERGYNLAALDAQIANREAAFDYLMTTYPTDVFIGVVNYVDHLQHFFYGRPELKFEGRHVEDMILYGYQAADRLLGRLLEKSGPQTHVLIVSDHGAGPLRHFLNVDRLLVEAGLLRFKSSRPSTGRNGLLFRLAKATPHWLRDRLPRQLKTSAKQMIRKEYEGEVDWEQTRLFRLSDRATMTMNVQGREPQGIIPPGQYQEARAEIIARLKQALTAYPEFGNCKFYGREELYHGDAVELSPDIVMVNEDFEISMTPSPHPDAPMLLSQEDMGRYGLPKRFKYGEHHMDGIFIAAGPGITPGTRVEGAQIADITPTMLALTAAGVPEGLDGKVLLGLESQATASTPSSAATAVYSKEEEAEVEERLRSLGYL